MLRRVFVTALTAVLMAACTQPAEAPAPPTAAGPDPAAIIGPLYDPYLTQGATFPSFERQAPWSRDLWTQLQAMMANSEARNEPILDFDPLIAGQDYQLSDLNVANESIVPGSHAVVRAHFNNFESPKEVVYDLIWEDGGWRVDNIRADGWDLREIAAQTEATPTP